MERIVRSTVEVRPGDVVTPFQGIQPRQVDGGSGSLAGMSVSDISTEVARQAHNDPFAGSILQENDPRAQALLQRQQDYVRAEQAKARGEQPQSEFTKGQKVYHTGRRKEFRIYAAGSSPELITVKNSQGQKFEVTKAKLVKL